MTCGPLQRHLIGMNTANTGQLCRGVLEDKSACPFHGLHDGYCSMHRAAESGGTAKEGSPDLKFKALPFHVQVSPSTAFT